MRLNGYTSDRSLRVGNNLRIPGLHTAPSATTPTAVASSNTTTYTVRRGDTLSEIAKRHQIEVKDLQTWNSMGNAVHLQPGQTLRLHNASAPVQSATATATAEPRHHVVKANEYPQQIAKNYGISLSEFLAWNNLGTNGKIYVGQRVVVGATGGGTAVQTASAPPAAPVARKIVHTVQRGDTSGLIAEKYGVGLSQLLAWNKLSARSTIHIGDQLVVHLAQDASAASSEATPEKKIHVVQRGQNPTTIAKAHGVPLDDLMKWNNWNRNPVLRVGDTVVVYAN
jgi:LysM repeat protein